MSDSDTDVTRLLIELGNGNSGAMARLMPIVYDELHRIAHRYRGGERPGHTLNTTDIVHEAFLRLVRLDRIDWQNRGHFFALAAQAMRRLLIDSAEKRRAQKRGGGAHDVTFNEEFMLSLDRSEELLALDEALKILKKHNERQHSVVECRFFGGLSVEETAQALDISPATVKRDWAFARAWLNSTLATDPFDAPPQ